MADHAGQCLRWRHAACGSLAPESVSCTDGAVSLAGLMSIVWRSFGQTGSQSRSCTAVAPRGGCGTAAAWQRCSVLARRWRLFWQSSRACWRCRRCALRQVHSAEGPFEHPRIPLCTGCCCCCKPVWCNTRGCMTVCCGCRDTYNVNLMRLWCCAGRWRRCLIRSGWTACAPATSPPRSQTPSGSFPGAWHLRTTAPSTHSLVALPLLPITALQAGSA